MHEVEVCARPRYKTDESLVDKAGCLHPRKEQSTPRIHRADDVRYGLFAHFIPVVTGPGQYVRKWNTCAIPASCKLVNPCQSTEMAQLPQLGMRARTAERHLIGFGDQIVNGPSGS